MEVAINYTVYIKNIQEIPYDVDYIIERHNQIMKQMEYTVKRSTYGVHRNASRYHIHYHTINIIPEDKKIYKILNAKIKTLKTKITLSYAEYILPEIKISYHYEYDENAILGYPLKEYENNKIMKSDINIQYLVNVTDIHLEELRSQANKIYVNSQKEHEKKELQKMEKTQQKKDLYKYLDTVVIVDEIPEGYGNIEHIMRFTIKQMLKFYKENLKNFSIHQLKNVAINYLYYKNKITEKNIIDYINV